MDSCSAGTAALVARVWKLYYFVGFAPHFKNPNIKINVNPLKWFVFFLQAAVSGGYSSSHRAKLTETKSNMQFNWLRKRTICSLKGNVVFSGEH